MINDQQIWKKTKTFDRVKGIAKKEMKDRLRKKMRREEIIKIKKNTRVHKHLYMNQIVSKESAKPIVEELI
jgi:predicted nucleotide-binding protein (sugar kinase/HSP70/actin superfamily)